MFRKRRSTLHPDDINYLTEARAAVMHRSPKGGRLLLWMIMLFFGAMLYWAQQADIDEVTRGEGKVIPSQQIQIVQNLEGGILSKIFVAEGDMVEPDQTLLQIDDTRFASTLKESQSQFYALQAKIARLAAQAEDKPFQVDAALTQAIPQQVAQERALFQSQQQALQNLVEIHQQQMLQRKQELVELRSRRDQHHKSHQLVLKELKITRPLVPAGAISEVEVLRLERQATELLGEKLSAQKAIPRIRSTLVEAKKKIKDVQFEFRNKAQVQRNTATAELAAMLESAKALTDRVSRTIVRSPVRGTIKRIKVTTVGGVIQPGMDLVEIVPSDDTLLVEVKIRPSDIGFLHAKQKAIVKFTAYDFSIYGGLEGLIEHISADTIQEENEEESYYLVKVRTKQRFLQKNQRKLPIIPGMVAVVDILTGKKTVLDYLLKPILKAKQSALRER